MTKPNREELAQQGAIIDHLGPGLYGVESRSRPGELHIVDTNVPSCPCPAFYWRGGCYHLQQVAEWIDKNEVSESE